jgi:hypothetical protein
MAKQRKAWLFSPGQPTVEKKALQLLETLAVGSPQAWLTEETRRVLARLEITRQ